MAEFVAQTSAAVAVDEDLTTLIDWTNIENVSGFTLIVENAGGGSANDLTDVQIDTSSDGGVADINLDQHAGVPAVPIADGNAPSGTFTETAAFVRVRALCAAGEDTTTNAFLSASSATGRICTLADVKDRLGISATENDITINRIINGLLTVFENVVNRPLIVPATDITEYYTGESSYLQLRRYPVVAITSIKEAVNYDFDNTSALAADTDYRVINNGLKGLLSRIYTKWYQSPDAIQVIYRGGFCAAGATPSAGETAWPADLREAAIEQASFIWKRRHDIGLSGVSDQGGSINKNERIQLLPLVRDILAKYQKPQL